jgi:transcription elongation factor Elf1
MDGANLIFTHEQQEDIPMVINCLKCHTEYRLHGELLQRAKKGMPVNCSKCGCCFEVLIITPTLQDEEAIPRARRVA